MGQKKKLPAVGADVFVALLVSTEDTFFYVFTPDQWSTVIKSEAPLGRAAFESNTGVCLGFDAFIKLLRQQQWVVLGTEEDALY